MNPYPNVTGPGQPAQNCEAANETYIPGKAVIGNVPGATGTAHEVTTREQNLFGEPYSASTLKELGIRAPAKTRRERADERSELVAPL